MYKAITVAGVLLALTAGPALAQRNRDDDRAGRNLEGFYLGGGVGDFSSEIRDIDRPGDVNDVGIDFTDSSNAMKVFAGWNFNRFFAVQGDYIDFGDSSGAVAPSVGSTAQMGSNDVQGLAPSIVGTIPIGPIELFGRLGVIFYEIDANLTGGRLIDDSGSDMVWSAGLGIDILDRANLRLEYEEIDIPQLDKADALWLNFAWKF
ncbi:MAG TPA: outer membrane beta-barrel protein [Gammaproteobacteria bacterium]|nr:outer membrane beta-barrel protein [Gammaproteobacteria bacterium]